MQEGQEESQDKLGQYYVDSNVDEVEYGFAVSLLNQLFVISAF